MAYITVTLDDYWTDNTGQFENTQLENPAGKLAAGQSTGRSTSIAALANFAALLYFGEGTGNTVENFGAASNATRLSGTWVQDADGSYYMNSPRLSISNHSSMALNSARHVAGVLQIRDPNASCTLLHKLNHVKLSVDANMRLVLTRYSNRPWQTNTYIQETTSFSSAMGKALTIPDTWITVGFVSAANKLLRLYINGVLVDQGIHDYKIWPDPYTNALIIGSTSTGSQQFTGDMRMFAYSGDGTAPDFPELFRETLSGSWISEVIDLGDTYALDRVTHQGFLNEDHTAAVTVRLSPDSDFIDPQIVDVSLHRDHILYPDTKVFYPDQPAQGRYLQAIVGMKTKTQVPSPLRPNLYNLQLRFRSL